jgi:hypothetical protein
MKVVHLIAEVYSKLAWLAKRSCGDRPLESDQEFTELSLLYILLVSGSGPKIAYWTSRT